MNDFFGRAITYVRVSVTDLCNLRCRYCMPEEGVVKYTRADILSYEEIWRVIRALSVLGIRKVRLTGGEPLLRKDLAALVRSIRRIPDIQLVTLTTNGVRLREFAIPLKEAGLDYVNLSLDTMRPGTFSNLTRRDEFFKVQEGLAALGTAGFHDTRINCIPLRGVNEEDIVPLAMLAKDSTVRVRFIELMPVGCAYESGLRGIPMREVKRILEDAFGEMETIGGEARNAGPAEYVRPRGFRGMLGFIDAVDHKFCTECNRVRLTAEGFLKLCLHHPDGLDVRALLRGGATDEVLKAALADAIRRKPSEHTFGGTGDSRYMYQVGG